MSVLEICMVVMTVATALVAIAVVALALRVAPALRRVEELIADLRRSLRGVDELVDEATGVVQRVAQLEQRVEGTAHLVLDRIEPPIRTAAAVMSGIRATAAAFLNGRHRSRSKERESPSERRDR